MRIRNFICLMLSTVLFATTGCSTLSELPASTEPKEAETEDSRATSETPVTENEPTAPVTAVPYEPVTVEGPALPKDKTYSILFIGNSYTETNSMPTTSFQRFTKVAGYKVEIDTVTKGAYTLTKMADPNDPYGAKVEKALTGTKQYDFVILQEQSVTPAVETSVAGFYSAVRNLAARIRAAGAKPILYSTWGRKEGNSTLTKYGWTTESMTWKLAAAYEAIGAELNIPVAHAGLAFYEIYTNHGEINTYHSDCSHPNYQGSFLAAATLFAKIFNVDPATVPYNGTLTPEKGALLRHAAARAVFHTPTIPDQYKTVSAGVGN